MADENKDGIRMGDCIYEKEIVELKEKLKARGICLIVIDGERNKDILEVSSVIQKGDVELACKGIVATALKMFTDIKPFVTGIYVGPVEGAPIDDDYHTKEKPMVN